MKRNTWFRAYSEALDDPKVQRLHPALFKAWFNLLCLACEGDGVLPSDDDIAFRLRCSPQDAKQHMDELILAGLIDIRPDGARVPHNWDQRQFVSDSSTERVRKFRMKRGKTVSSATETPAETTMKRNETFHVATPEQSRAETDQNRTPPLSPQGGEKPKAASLTLRLDPNGVQFDGSEISLDPHHRKFWLEQFGGDGERLDLALIQAAAYVQPNSFRPLAAQVGAQLARSAADRRDRDRRYQQSAAARAPAQSTSPQGRRGVADVLRESAKAGVSA